MNGGERKRSHVTIKDLTAFYQLLLKAPPAKIAGRAFNVVAENQSIQETAETVIKELSGDSRRARNMIAHIEVKEATDTRSYAVSGELAKKVLDFTPEFTVRDAIYDLKVKFADGMWPDSLTNADYQNFSDAIA